MLGPGAHLKGRVTGLSTANVQVPRILLSGALSKGRGRRAFVCGAIGPPDSVARLWGRPLVSASVTRFGPTVFF
jgi:hypothetical protein